MKRYILKRLLATIPVMLIVAIVTFFLIHYAPGDPAQIILGDYASAEDVEALRIQMGLDKPVIEQFFSWLWGLLHGDLGTPYFYSDTMPVIILNHLIPSMSLALFALIIAIIIAIPCGVLAAKTSGSLADQLIMIFAMIGISIPGFLLGLILVLIFAVNLGILPAVGYKSLADGVFQWLRYLCLPALSLGIMHSALLTRMVRSSVLDILNSDFIKMAKAKGVKGKKLLFGHALRNAMLPIVTVIGQSMISLLSGAVVIENVFSIPGMGNLLVTAITKRDYAVVQADVMVIALINVVIMLIVDLLYGVLDPRIRVDG